MNLVTPDTGLLFWMVVIFGIVFFLLAKFGFPIITSMVDKRNAAIKRSLKDAREIEIRMAGMMQEHAQMLEDARKEQTDILRDAAEARKKIIADAKAQAKEEAEKILSDARTEIEVEKEAAIRASTARASSSDLLMAAFRLSTIEVMMGKPNFANRKKTMPKMTTIQKRRPVSGVTRFIRYRTRVRKQTMMANRAAPSIIPAAMIRVVRMLPALSG